MLIIFLWLVFFILPIGNRGLWAPDEPRYLQVAWEMSNSDNYVIPQINGGAYTHKPPLFFWLTILMSKVTPFEISSRCVSALASLGTLLLTFYAGRKYFSVSAGFTAALILMTSNLYLQLMYTGNIDTLLTFFVTLSMVAFWEGAKQNQYHLIIVSYISCGLGILTKGPVALLIPWISFVVWTAFRIYKRERPSYSHLIWGPVVSLMVVLAWLIPAGITGGKEYLYEILIRQNAGRTVDSFAHKQPWYYMIMNFPVLVLPWTFLIPVGVKNYRKTTHHHHDRAHVFHWIWLFVVLFFFSLISGKRGRYLLPLFPAFSILLSGSLDRIDHGKMTSGLFYFTAGLVYSALLVVILFPFIIPWLTGTYGVLSIFITHQQPFQLVILTTLFLPLGVIAFILTIQQIRKKSGYGSCYGLIAGILLMAGAGHVYYIPSIDYIKSAKHASAKIIEETGQENTIAFYERRLDHGWNYYLNRSHIPIISRSDMETGHPPYEIVICKSKNKITDSALTRLFEELGYRPFMNEPIGSNEYLIFRKKGGPS